MLTKTCATYLVRLVGASQTAAAGVGRRSAAASTMPLHHRDGHHSRYLTSPPHTTTHRHNTDITSIYTQPLQSTDT